MRAPLAGSPLFIFSVVHGGIPRARRELRMVDIARIVVAAQTVHACIINHDDAAAFTFFAAYRQGLVSEFSSRNCLPVPSAACYRLSLPGDSFGMLL